jgi:hypothetical protein
MVRVCDDPRDVFERRIRRERSDPNPKVIGEGSELYGYFVPRHQHDASRSALILPEFSCPCQEVAKHRAVQFPDVVVIVGGPQRRGLSAFDDPSTPPKLAVE